MNITKNNINTAFKAKIGEGLKTTIKEYHTTNPNLSQALKEIEKVYPDDTVDIFYDKDNKMHLCLNNKEMKNQPMFTPINTYFFNHLAKLLIAEKNEGSVFYKGASSLH